MKQKLEITANRILLVEGRDEVNFLEKFIEKFFNPEVAIQVIGAGGKDEFPKRLSAIRSQLQTRPNFESLGVIRDADRNSASAFQSVHDHLDRVGFQPPESHGLFSDASPSVGVYIMPNGSEPGAIETLCRQSVEHSDTGKCVNQYLDCLKSHNVMESRNEDKCFAHAYLAATKQPMARVGEGALQGVWDFDSPAFSDLRKFLHELYTNP